MCFISLTIRLQAQILICKEKVSFGNLHQQQYSAYHINVTSWPHLSIQSSKIHVIFFRFHDCLTACVTCTLHKYTHTLDSPTKLILHGLLSVNGGLELFSNHKTNKCKNKTKCKTIITKLEINCSSALSVDYKSACAWWASLLQRWEVKPGHKCTTLNIHRSIIYAVIYVWLLDI